MQCAVKAGEEGYREEQLITESNSQSSLMHKGARRLKEPRKYTGHHLPWLKFKEAGKLSPNALWATVGHTTGSGDSES